MNDFQNAIGADKELDQLRLQVRKLRYNPDLVKMTNNIKDMISEMSYLEVQARRTKRLHAVNDQKEKITRAMNHLEKLILMMQLLD